MTIALHSYGYIVFVMSRIREGETSIFKPDGSGGYKFVVRVQADEWKKLADSSN